MRKIIVTGPECSGKSTLALALSKKLDAVYVPEISRTLLTLCGNRYQYEDLLTLAIYQAQLESAARVGDKDWIVCDTSMLVLKVWSSFKFKKVHPFIEDSFLTSDSYLWLLCCPLDIWVADGLRTNPNDRDELFRIYQEELIRAGKPMLIVPPLPPDQRVTWVLDRTSQEEIY